MFSVDNGAFAAYPMGGYANLSIGIHTLRAMNMAGCISTATSFTIAGPLNCVAEGCTLGYWKNHTNRWSCYSPGTLYGAVFGNNCVEGTVGCPNDGIPASIESLTLLQALEMGGGGEKALARQSVAALLNACSRTAANANDRVNYALTTAQVIAGVNNAFLTNTEGAYASTLDGHNNAGCPLGGTRATTASLTSGDGHAAASAISIYPNPFSHQASVEFTLAKAERYTLQVLDVNGRVVSKVAAGVAEAGAAYRFQVEGRDLAEGVYMVRLTTDKSVQTVRLVLKK
jgi:hypothetical protein